MLRQVASSAAQVRTAVRACAETDLSAFTPDARPRAIVVAGMGSSGTAGDILGVVCGAGVAVQVLTLRAGRLPGWVGAADLVFAVSSSGTTHETLAVAREAARRGCRLVGVGAEASPLHRIAEQARAPFVKVDQAGTVLPRQTLWALTVPLLVVAERLGIAQIGAEVYEQTAGRLEEVSHQCRPASESFVNPGKSLGLDLMGGLPMIWGTSPLTAVVATRFASQLNENAKCPAIAGILPEVKYNQLGTFDGPFAGEIPQFPLRLVIITDVELRERVTTQDIATTIGELASQRGISVSELATEGEHPLLRLAAVVQLTDYASVYLGIASGIDPGQADVIRDLPARIE
ncbi:MAG: mannose-6-phosphate isomerase [Streptosporangiaceae bacterium]|nr:mannose-6-phosphate isomerase [Streptosporangiaceae bacterium]